MVPTLLNQRRRLDSILTGFNWREMLGLERNLQRSEIIRGLKVRLKGIHERTHPTV